MSNDTQRYTLQEADAELRRRECMSGHSFDIVEERSIANGATGIFILARIAEDEERAQFVARQIEGNNWQPFEQWKLSWHDEYDLLCIEPSRALAECEAKRRIVDALSEQIDLSHHEQTIADARYMLRFLALPFADHPDYREEWRP